MRELTDCVVNWKLQESSVQALVGNGSPQLRFKELTHPYCAYTLLLEDIAEENFQARVRMRDADFDPRWLPDPPQAPTTADDDARSQRNGA